MSQMPIVSMDGFRFLAVTGPFVDRSGPFRTARWDRWAKTVHSYSTKESCAADFQCDCLVFRTNWFYYERE